MSIFYCSPNIFEVGSSNLAKKINLSRYSSIYGVPRGGIFVAIRLSQLLNLPMIEKDKINNDTLIVDDLIDSGQTRNKYADNDFACLYDKSCSPVFNNTYVGETIQGWVVFFWEKENNEQPGEDAVIRILQSKNLKITKENIKHLHVYINEYLTNKEIIWS